MALKEGLLTSGDREAVVLVGPIEPATKHLRPGFSFSNSWSFSSFLSFIVNYMFLEVILHLSMLIVDFKHFLLCFVSQNAEFY